MYYVITAVVSFIVGAVVSYFYHGHITAATKALEARVTSLEAKGKAEVKSL
jgi:uncharacterized protein (DUF2164 family)